MERLKNMKENLMACVQGQMNDLRNVDTKELGEAIDMIKDLEEAIYYATITKAMGEKKEHEVENKHYYPMYYNPTSRGGNGNSYYSEPMNRPMYYDEPSTKYTQSNYAYGDEQPVNISRDVREGRSGQSRKTYMESKEMHHPKSTQMKELENYMHELSADITEMIQDATPEEKAMLEKKIFALANKVGQV